MEKKTKNKLFASGAIVALIAIVLVANCMNCGAVKPIAKVVSTIASTLCETLATEKLEEEGPDALDGFDVSTWCQVKKNFDPILDIVLAAQKDAEKVVSDNLKAEKDDKEPDEKPDEPDPGEPEDPDPLDSSPDAAE
jgi:hypothetical protein